MICQIPLDPLGKQKAESEDAPPEVHRFLKNGVCMCVCVCVCVCVRACARTCTGLCIRVHVKARHMT